MESSERWHQHVYFCSSIPEEDRQLHARDTTTSLCKNTKKIMEGKKIKNKKCYWSC